MPAKKPLVLDSNGNQQQIQTGDFVDVAQGGTGAVSATGARTSLGLVIGTDVQAHGASLDALQALATTGSVVRTGANTFVTRTFVVPATGMSITFADGVSGNPTIALANDLAALEGLAGTGIAVRTAADTWVQRTVTGTAGNVSVTNGDGVAGNPVIDLATVANGGGGTLHKQTYDTYGRVSGYSSVVTGDLTALLNTTYLGLGGGTLTGALVLAADPIAALGAATKQYVDAFAAGMISKPSVVAMSSTNITVTNPGTAVFDGVTLVATNRLLLVGQTAPAENGPWVFNGAASALTRPTDFDTSAEVVSGSSFFVDQGTSNSDSTWSLVSTGPYVLGTTGLTFTQTSSLGQITAGTGLAKSGNTLSADLATRLVLNGNKIDLASGVATPGTYTKLTVDTYGRVTGTATAAPSDIGAQAASAELTALAAQAATGIVVRTAAGTYAQRTLTAPAAGMTVTYGDGVAGNPTLVLANDLGALEALSGTGFAARTAVDTWVQRVITGTAGRITITNGDGVSGAPTIDMVASIVTPGTYQSVTVDTYGRVTNGTTSSATGLYVGSTLTNDEVATLTICSAVYSDAAGGVKKANANALGTSLVVGLASADIASAASGIIATAGEISATTGQWDATTGQTGGLTFGARYFLDNTTAGKITSTAPTTGFIVPVGQALSATKLLVRIGERIQL